MNIYAVEDGIIAKQSGADDNYVHNNVLRQALTGQDGESISLTSGKVVSRSMKFPVPDNVADMQKMRILAFLSYEESFKGGVEGALYENYGEIIDNVINIPLNGFANFEYEN